MNLLFVTLAEGAGAKAWIVGAVCLLILFVLMGAMLVFGKGREHT